VQVGFVLAERHIGGNAVQMGTENQLRWFQVCVQVLPSGRDRLPRDIVPHAGQQVREQPYGWTFIAGRRLEAYQFPRQLNGINHNPLTGSKS
jgi:hypothetical protein